MLSFANETVRYRTLLTNTVRYRIRQWAFFVEEQKVPDSADGHVRRQAAKRAEILAAATAIFFEEGYGRTSMDRVLSRVGGSKRTLYNHFPSKEALFKAIVRQVSDRVLAALTPKLDSGDMRQTLIDMGADYLQVLTSPEGIALYRAMVSEAPHFPDLARAFFQTGPGRATQHLAGFLRRQAETQGLEIPDPDLAAAQFLGMVRGDAHLRAVLHAQIPTQNAIRAIATAAAETFLQGCARTKTA